MLKDNRYVHRALRVLLVLLAVLGLALAAPALMAVRAQETPLSLLAVAADGQISVRLPEGWVYQDVEVEAYTSALAFGDSALALRLAVDDITGQLDANFEGRGGVIGIFDPDLFAGMGAAEVLGILAQNLEGFITSNNGQILNRAEVKLPTGGVGIVWLCALPTNQQGFIGVLNFGESVIFTAIYGTPQNFVQNQNLLAAILQTISVPAESGVAPAQPTPPPFSFPTLPPEGSPTPEAGGPAPTVPPFSFPTLPPEGSPTPEAGGPAPTVPPFGFPTLPPEGSPAPATPSGPMGRTALVSAGEGRISIVLPETWSHADLIGEESLLAFGDSPEALESRLAISRTGTGTVSPDSYGGLILLLNAAELGLQPPIDVVKVLEAETATVEILEAVQSFDLAGNSGAYAVIRAADSAQQGFIVLVLFGDQVVFASATGTAANFDAGRDVLFGIIQSIRVPAERPRGLPGLLGGPRPTPTPG